MFLNETIKATHETSSVLQVNTGSSLLQNRKHHFARILILLLLCINDTVNDSSTLFNF